MYQYLIIILIIIFSLNLGYAELSQIFPEIFFLEKLFFIDLILLLALIFGWAIMRIQKKRHPERYIGPEALKDRPQEASAVGIIKYLGKELYRNDKDLLIDQKDLKPIKAKKPLTDADKRFGFVVVSISILLIIIGCLIGYLIVVNNYQGTSKFIDDFEHTQFFKIIDKMGQRHY